MLTSAALVGWPHPGPGRRLGSRSAGVADALKPEACAHKARLGERARVQPAGPLTGRRLVRPLSGMRLIDPLSGMRLIDPLSGMRLIDSLSGMQLIGHPPGAHH